MNEGVAEASERMLKGAGAFAHETPYAVGKHYRPNQLEPRCVSRARAVFEYLHVRDELLPYLR